MRVTMRIYRPILQRAWETLWRVKYLWPLGLFAVLYTGPSGEYGLLSGPNFRAFLAPADTLYLLKRLLQADAPRIVWERLVEAFRLQGGQITVALVVLLLMTLVLTILIVLAQGALIRGLGQHFRGKAEHLARLVENVWPVLGRVFIISVGSFLGLSLFMFLLALPFWASYLLSPSMTTLALSELAAILVFLPVFFAVSFTSKFAIALVVLENRALYPAIREGWAMFRRNWLATLELALILFGLNLVVFYLVLAIPRPLLESNTMLGGMLFLGLLFVAGALYTVFQYACWVALYLGIRENRIVSKVTRIFQGSTIPGRPLPRQS